MFEKRHSGHTAEDGWRGGQVDEGKGPEEKRCQGGKDQEGGRAAPVSCPGVAPGWRLGSQPGRSEGSVREALQC